VWHTKTPFIEGGRVMERTACSGTPVVQYESLTAVLEMAYKKNNKIKKNCRVNPQVCFAREGKCENSTNWRQRYI